MVELVDFLKALVGPGAEIAVGAIMAFIAENWSWYQKKAKGAKRSIFAGVCVGVPLVAAAIGAAFGYFPLEFETTFWYALQAGAVVFLSSQVAHIRFIRRK